MRRPVERSMGMAAQSRREHTALEALDLAHLFHPNTNLPALHASAPTVFQSASGIHVRDDRGTEYIDAMAGLWCTTLGYGDEELAGVAYEQMRTLSFAHLFTGKSSEPAVRLCEKLVELSPFDRAHVFLGNSGSDANDTQIKLAWYYNNAIGRPLKKRIIARERAYHGVTIGAAALTGLDAFHGGFDLPLPLVIRADCPDYYRGAEPGESEADYASRLAGNLEELILRENPDTIAAMIAEPLMGVGGVLLPPAGYFAKIQAVLDRYDIMLIDDEVITGFGRCGHLWGAEAFGMRPDTLTVAKALSSAYQPISAVIVPDRIYEPIVEAGRGRGMFGHGFTYSGHPVAAAVALRTLEIYERRGLYAHVRELAPVFQAQLTALASHPLVGDARGIGLVGGLELVADKTTRLRFSQPGVVGSRCMTFCQTEGLIVRAVGDVIVVCPPYIVSEGDVVEIFRRLVRGLDATWNWASSEKLVVGGAVREG